MSYEVYAFDPDAELVATCEELDDAVAQCEELVHEDGYRSAEVWDDDGRLVHAASDAYAEPLVARGCRAVRAPAPPLPVAGILAGADGDVDPTGAVRDVPSSAEPETTPLAQVVVATLEQQAAPCLPHDGAVITVPPSSVAVTVPPEPQPTVPEPMIPETTVLGLPAVARVQWFGA